MAAMCRRAFYGTRISVLFGLMLTLLQRDGRAGGAIQGYYGGKVDLWGNVLLKYGRGCRRCFDYFTFQRRTA